MAHATIHLTNGVEIKKAPVGYSWTTLFFGGWPAVFRQDWIWGVGGILGNIFLYGIPGVVCSFFYNKAYIKGLIEKGYKIMPSTEITDEQLRSYLGYVTLPKAE